MRRLALLALLLSACATHATPIGDDDDPPIVCGGPGGCEPPRFQLAPYEGAWQLALTPTSADPCPGFQQTTALRIDAKIADDQKSLALSPEGQRSIDAHSTHLDAGQVHVIFTLHDDWGTSEGAAVAPAVDYDLIVDADGTIAGTASTSLHRNTDGAGTDCHYDYLVGGTIQ